MVSPPFPRSWDPETKPHKFCPGCGHGIALKALGWAVDELEAWGRLVFGCDIGCSLLAWNFFRLDTVQTHHGRTLPVMLGVKRARPDLLVVAYVGDGGGYAIGAQHLVTCAARGDPLTCILINNTVYAMTGGQMAPTTLPGQKTETSPFGKAEGLPLRGPELVAHLTGGRAFVARASVARPRQLKECLKKALVFQEGGGFSFVEILSTCPTNWRTDARGTWEFLEGPVSSYFPVGELSGGEDR